ncbi:hypothetical protein [Ruminococcus difficilis]|uniref:AraC family transcriptional regulator n=1 Tax=Ruminococcus difficilis TaxID=2763069 RepID=A0A934WQH2_9FIRM|nr:hypothetical protein [Ruminococcus difficilis]MBK6087878.1 hypothetical protein [Ruminococcus difficilis]
MTKRNRLIALLLAAVVLFVMAFSLFVVAAEAGHDCLGEDCPICELIAVCENNVRGLSLILVFISLIVALALMRTFITYSRPFVFDTQTPVSLKVKLTN